MCGEVAARTTSENSAEVSSVNHRASIWLSREQYNELCRIESDEFLVGEITMLFDQLDWNADVAPGIRLVAVFGTFDSYVLNGGCFKFFDSWHESRSSDDFLSPILAVPKDIPGCLGLEPILLKGRQLREAIDT